jgi:NAD(P)-dependent dehydrogenase (short-subunit alcohol dehydrogenase family)
MARNILVIGGGSGIGRAIVEELVENGDNVYAASQNIKEANLPSSVTTISFNVLEDEKLTDLPDELHGLAYCPGSISLKPFKSFSIDKLRQELELNYLGAVKVLHQVIDKLKKSKTGSVVFFSTVAVQTGLPYHSAVSASKGAIEGLTRSLAAEYAPNVRFNAIAPSLTDTPLASNLLSNDKKREANAERHPMKKVGSPEDIANMATYLLGDKGSWITGQIITIDGGMGSLRSL